MVLDNNGEDYLYVFIKRYVQVDAEGMLLSLREREIH